MSAFGGKADVNHYASEGPLIAISGHKDEGRKPGVSRIASAGGFPVSPLGRVAPFLMLMPVFTVAGGVLILGETLTLQTIAGGLLAIAAVTYIRIEKER